MTYNQEPAKKNTKALGLVYLYTGEGKGKTSAALGTMLRALSSGWSVTWIAFYKEASWGISEYEFPHLLLAKHRRRLEMLLLGKGFYIQNPEEVVTRQDQASLKVASTKQGKVTDDDTAAAHRAAAHSALATALAKLQQPQPPQLLILDEVCNAIADGLIDEQLVLDLLVQRQQCHVVLTGRFASERLMAHADLVTEMKNLKHPYDQGIMAVKGLDF